VRGIEPARIELVAPGGVEYDCARRRAGRLLEDQTRMTSPIAASPRSLCLLRLSAVGDACHAVAAVRALQGHLPEARLTWIVGRLEATLVGDIPGIEFIIYDKRGGYKAWRGLRAALAGRRFDALLHMQAALRASLVSLAVPAATRIGFDRARAKDLQWLFTDAAIAPQPRAHALEALLGFAWALGAPLGAPRWDIPIPAAARAYADESAPQEPYFVISPCSSQRARNFRNWSAERYAAVVDHAAARGLRCVLTGGPTALEREYAARIKAAARHAPVDLIGRTDLKQLLAVLAGARAVVCPDSGPAHMADSVGTPVVGLYATSNKDRTGPYRSRAHCVDRYPDALRRFLGKGVDEVPWGARVRHPDAMDMIEVAEVTAKLDGAVDAGRLA
jgi:heptosyltransferase I